MLAVSWIINLRKFYIFKSVRIFSFTLHFLISWPRFFILFILIIFSDFLCIFFCFFTIVQRVRFLCVFRLCGILSTDGVFTRPGLFFMNRVIRIFLGHNQSFYSSAL